MSQCLIKGVCTCQPNEGVECMQPPSAMRYEIAALRKDAERLDWLEKKLFASQWNGVVDSGSKTHWRIAGDYRHATAQMQGETFRAAIDAAIAAKGGA